VPITNKKATSLYMHLTMVPFTNKKHANYIAHVSI